MDWETSRWPDWLASVAWGIVRRPRCRLVVVALLMSAIFAAPPLGHAATGATTTFVSLPDGVHIAGLAVGVGAVWGTNARAGTVVRLDPRTNKGVATIPGAAPSPDCDRCWGAVAARGDVVWAAMDTAGPVVARIDPAS